MPKPISEFQKKIKVIEKLTSMGITTEEQVKQLTPADLSKGNFSFVEFSIISDLQIAIKSGTVYSFLLSKSEVK